MGTECKSNTTVTKLIAGICVIVVAALIIWGGSSIVANSTNISVLQQASEYTRKDLTELKIDTKNIQASINEIASNQKILISKLK